jgi:hypothetical protein
MYLNLFIWAAETGNTPARLKWAHSILTVVIAMPRGAEGVVGAAGSGVIGATSRIVAEYPRPRFW